jgi:hypothetical protein
MKGDALVRPGKLLPPGVGPHRRVANIVSEELPWSARNQAPSHALLERHWLRKRVPCKGSGRGERNYAD